MTGLNVLTGGGLVEALGVESLGNPTEGFGTVAAAKVEADQTTAIPGIQVAFSGIYTAPAGTDETFDVSAKPITLG